MPNSLILCGGTGAHIAAAFLRLHTLGCGLGFFRPGNPDGLFEFPKLYLVDQDAGDRDDQEPTAWQLARQLIDRHPGRYDWLGITGRQEAPQPVHVSPLPVGEDKDWYHPPRHMLERRFEGSPLLPVLASARQKQIDYSKGMMGSPAIGSLLFKLKEYDERDAGLNRDETFGELLRRQGRLVVAGSGVGGTGAAIGPTLAQRLADQTGNRVMAVMVLQWFAFEEEQALDDERRKQAARRNKVLRQNADSALAFYGERLAGNVAAVPIGMPEQAWLRRNYTGDAGQPRCESFIHAVAALCSFRHFLQPYGPGFYAVGAVDPRRLGAGTAIPGGTLQDLANQAATLAEILTVWQRVLETAQTEQIQPALYQVVAAAADPQRVARELEDEIAHYRQQLAWMRDVLSIEGRAAPGFTREHDIRQRLFERGRQLEVAKGTPPEHIPWKLFTWTARWIRESAPSTGGLRREAERATGAHWPDSRDEAIRPPISSSGDLTKVAEASIPAVLKGFVDRQYLAENGWPHPLAAADFFRHAIKNGDLRETKQLELLFVGLVSERFEMRELGLPSAPDRGVSLEYLLADHRRQSFQGLSDYGLFDRQRGGALIGFTSPWTLFCPVPFMNEVADNQIWQEIWSSLSGVSDTVAWYEAPAPSSWGHLDSAARQIRAWIEEEKRRFTGGAPAWTRILGTVGHTGAAPFGAGARVRVFWDGERLVELDLPTRKPDVVWVPPASLPELPAEVLAGNVPELERLLDQDQNELYSKVELRKPDHPRIVHGYWEDHLNQLRDRGIIQRWSRSPKGEVLVATQREGVLHWTVLPDSEVLSRSTISISSCVPFRQDPIPGSEIPVGFDRYPDLPIKADYLDLIATEGGETLSDLLRKGADLRPLIPRPRIRRDSQGREVILWDNLHLRGRKDRLPIEIRLEQGTESEERHRAHLMVWPRFRDRHCRWKAYYIYEYCSDRRLFCDVIWLDARSTTAAGNSSNPLHRRHADGRTPAIYPVSFQKPAQPNQTATHTGGPPVALSLRNVLNNQELGLYLVPLDPLPVEDIELSLAVDFGTAHSVTAFKAGGESFALELPPELHPDSARRGLTLHLSEDKSHVEADEARGGLLATAPWLPSYRGTANGVLPSELLLVEPLSQAKGRDLADWLPLRDYTIPPMDIGRSRLSEYILSDFKWDEGSSFFRGQEKGLREHYLGLFLELALADTIYNHLHVMPTRAVNLTFTYPLRSTDPQVRALQDSLQRALQRGNRSLGLPLVLKNGVGLFDESRAAQLSTETFGEVCTVGDLGGGTLDLFISAYSPGQPFREVADSVRLGGNVLLKQIAAQPQGYLPNDGNWFGGGIDARETATKLRAWMRAEGSWRLFGPDAAARPEMKALGVTGFAKPSDAHPTRQLIDRYFRLVVEYMARNLVAFLVGEWFPKVDPTAWNRLKLSVQLRGNGWRMHYDRDFQSEGYLEATRTVQRWVRERVESLWRIVPDNHFPAPAEDRYWQDPGHYEVRDPKSEPIRSVVGRTAMAPEEVARRWYTHTLVDLEVMRPGDFHIVPWTQRIPFDTGGSRSLQIERLAPPVVLSHPRADQQIEIDLLEADLQREINDSLQHADGVIVGETSFRAWIAPLVWEAVFKSRAFWPLGGKR